MILHCRKLKKVFSCFLTAALVAAFSVPNIAVWGAEELNLTGDGTKNNPYLIEDADDLVALQQYVNEGGGSQVYHYYRQTADIDLSGIANWTPIGTKKTGSSLAPSRFSGTYDGGGHSIKNMKITSSGGEGVGLFGYISKAEIRDLRVDGVISHTKVSGHSALYDVGGIVGASVQLMEADITNPDSSCVISGCSSDVDISAQSLVGGVIGNTETDTFFENCDYTGNITTELTASSAYESYGIGGICGTSQGNDSFSGCVNSGTITTTDGDASVGGIVGWTSNTAQTVIDSCYNAGALTTAEASQNTGVGGIVGKRTNGYADDDASEAEKMKITNCYNSGILTAGAGSAASEVGGIVGRCVTKGVMGGSIWTGETLHHVYSKAGSAAYIVRGISNETGGSSEQAEASAGMTDIGTFTELNELNGKLGEKFSRTLLSWQDSTTKYNVGFEFADAKTGAALEGVSVSVNGADLTGGLTAGSYDYTASKEGYDTARGSFAVVRGDMTVRINMRASASETPDPDEKDQDTETPTDERYKEPAKDENGVYLISTAAELAWLDREATSVSLPRAQELKDFDARLTADIDMSGYDWIPISPRNDNSAGYVYSSARTYYSGGAYSGTFDGDGHTITNLKIEITNPYKYGGRFDAVGLFGFVKEAAIKDLGITGSIKITDNIYSTIGEWMCAGAVAGFATTSTITGCYTDIDIDVHMERGANGAVKYANPCDSFVGGIIGAMTLTTQIDNCYSRGAIRSDSTRDYSIGGIVGQSRLSTHSEDSASDNVIQRCWSDMTLHAQSDHIRSGNGFIGGIVGEVDGLGEDSIPEISYCFALNTILKGDLPAGSDLVSAGRIVGNGDKFASNGKYNYGLDTMEITDAVKATGNPDASGYRTAWGRDITSSAALKESSYTDVMWNQGSVEPVWAFDGVNYPVFVWQQAEPTGDDILRVVPVSYDLEAPSNQIEYTAPTGGWKTGQANTFSLKCDAAACTVILKKAGGALQLLKSTAADGVYNYTVSIADGDLIEVYVADDVNLDGKLDVGDVMQIADAAISGGGDMSEAVKIAADVNGDQTIDILDVLDVLAAGLGKTELIWQ